MISVLHHQVVSMGLATSQSNVTVLKDMEEGIVNLVGGL